MALLVHCFQVELDCGALVFCGGRKALVARTRTKINSTHMWRQQVQELTLSCNGGRTTSTLSTAPCPFPNLTLRLTITILIERILAPRSRK